MTKYILFHSLSKSLQTSKFENSHCLFANSYFRLMSDDQFKNFDLFELSSTSNAPFAPIPFISIHDSEAFSSRWNLLVSKLQQYYFYNVHEPPIRTLFYPLFYEFVNYFDCITEIICSIPPEYVISIPIYNKLPHPRNTLQFTILLHSQILSQVLLRLCKLFDVSYITFSLSHPQNLLRAYAQDEISSAFSSVQLGWKQLIFTNSYLFITLLYSRSKTLCGSLCLPLVDNLIFSLLNFFFQTFLSLKYSEQLSINFLNSSRPLSFDLTQLSIDSVLIDVILDFLPTSLLSVEFVKPSRKYLYALTSNCYQFNEEFKTQVALQQHYFGIPYIICQHGATINTSHTRYPHPCLYLSDTYIAFGEQSSPEITSGFFLKIPRFLALRSFIRLARMFSMQPSYINILLIMPQLDYRLSPFSYYSLNHQAILDVAVNTIRTFSNDIIKFTVRFGSLESTTAQLDFNYLKRNLNSNFIASFNENTFLEAAFDSHLCIFLHDSTGILELLSQSLPVTAYIDPSGYSLLSSEFKSLYLTLAENKVLAFSQDDLINNVRSLINGTSLNYRIISRIVKPLLKLEFFPPLKLFKLITFSLGSFAKSIRL